MLSEIICDKFLEPKVEFKSGLNVVIGDQNATNSIGKSSMLMVIDFVHGGSSLLKHNIDIVDELGHHDYKFKFRFHDKDLYFTRSTNEPELVYECDSNYVPQTKMNLPEYNGLLRHHYALDNIEASFRAVVSRFSRIWGKKNDDVRHPLHDNPNEKAWDAITVLIKLFGKYETIAGLERILKSEESSLSSLRAAFRERHIPQITKRKHAENIKTIAAAQEEIQEIKSDLAKFALNIKEITNREIADLKFEKDSLIDLRFKIQDELKLIQRNRSKIGSVTNKYFQRIKTFFPEINQEKLQNIDTFHGGLSAILRKDLNSAEERLTNHLRSVNQEIELIDRKISNLLTNIENPSNIVDRVFSLTGDLEQAGFENRYYDSHSEIVERRDNAQIDLEETKQRLLTAISKEINLKISEIVKKIFGDGHKSPFFSAFWNNYVFEIFEDTGTGTAYSNLVIFDIALFELTPIPFIVHDSMLFKNVENRTIDGLIPYYESLYKQSFIAIDEIGKYDINTQKLLNAKKFLELNDSKVLYIKDWRRKNA